MGYLTDIGITQAVAASESILAASITDWGKSLLSSVKGLIIIAVVVGSAVLGLVIMVSKKSYLAGIGGVLGGLVLAVVIAQSTDFGASIAEESEKAGFGSGTSADYQDMFGD